MTTLTGEGENLDVDLIDVNFDTATRDDLVEIVKYLLDNQQRLAKEFGERLAALQESLGSTNHTLALGLKDLRELETAVSAAIQSGNKELNPDTLVHRAPSGVQEVRAKTLFEAAILSGKERWTPGDISRFLDRNEWSSSRETVSRVRDALLEYSQDISAYIRVREKPDGTNILVIKPKKRWVGVDD